jgi:hypothetical protein
MQGKLIPTITVLLFISLCALNAGISAKNRFSDKIKKIEIPAEWEKILPVKINGVTLKTCQDEEKIYFMLKFPAPEKKTEHMNWHWNQEKGFYIPGNEKETSVTLIITQSVNSDIIADIWIWRSARTGPAGFADDGFAISDSICQKKKGQYFFPDSGIPPWQSRFFTEFAGMKIRRFYFSPPSGSASDVRAEAEWANGFWTVILSRKKQTGNRDDVQMKPDNVIYATPLPRLPEKSDLKRKNKRLKILIPSWKKKNEP